MLIVWNDFLLLLEHQTVHLTRPKNVCATGLVITHDDTLSIFATEKALIEYIGRYNTWDERESDTIATR